MSLNLESSHVFPVDSPWLQICGGSSYGEGVVLVRRIHCQRDMTETMSGRFNKTSYPILTVFGKTR